MTVKEVLQAAIELEVESILKLIESDPHQFSDRPCSTCRAISSIIGKDFGCVKAAKKREIE